LRYKKKKKMIELGPNLFEASLSTNVYPGGWPTVVVVVFQVESSSLAENIERFSGPLPDSIFSEIPQGPKESWDLVPEDIFSNRDDGGVYPYSENGAVRALSVVEYEVERNEENEDRDLTQIAIIFPYDPEKYEEFYNLVSGGSGTQTKSANKTGDIRSALILHKGDPVKAAAALLTRRT
jgi:hypothetical protein